MSESTAPAPFVYTSKGGEEVNLINFALIPAGVFRKVRHLNGLEQTFAVVEAGVVSPEDLDKVDALPLHEMEDLFSAWSDGASVPSS